MIFPTPEALAHARRIQREQTGRVYVDGQLYVSPQERERRARQERAIAAAAKAIEKARKREQPRHMIGVSIYGWHTFELGEGRLYACPDHVTRETWLSRISASARAWTISHGAVFSTKALQGGIQVTRVK